MMEILFKQNEKWFYMKWMQIIFYKAAMPDWCFIDLVDKLFGMRKVDKHTTELKKKRKKKDNSK